MMTHRAACGIVPVSVQCCQYPLQHQSHPRQQGVCMCGWEGESMSGGGRACMHVRGGGGGGPVCGVCSCGCGCVRLSSCKTYGAWHGV
jgi:hypothetical protein